jgi:hypothetical protein
MRITPYGGDTAFVIATDSAAEVADLILSSFPENTRQKLRKSTPAKTPAHSI